MIGIYKITNTINNKIYIGQSIHIERRWAEHCIPSNNSVIAQAIRKYGKENFIFEVLEQYTTANINKMNEREMYYIHKYNSIVPNGYNVTDFTGVQHTTFFTISKQDVLEIISLLKNTQETFDNIAKKYNIDKKTVSRINNGYTHKMKDFFYPIRKNNQYDRFHNKNNYEKKYCIDCGKIISNQATRCQQCESIRQRKVKRPSREELKKLIRNQSFVSIGKIYGVTDNAVRKWCDKFGLPRKVSDIKKYTDEEWEKL